MSAFDDIKARRAEKAAAAEEREHGEVDPALVLKKAQRKVAKALDHATTSDDISKLGNTLAKLVSAGQKLEEASYGEGLGRKEPPHVLPEPGVPS